MDELKENSFLGPSAISLLKGFIEQINAISEGGNNLKVESDGKTSGMEGMIDEGSILSKLAIFIVEYMGISIEELEENLEFTDAVKLCRIGQMAVRGNQDSPYFYFWNTIENRIVFRRIINTMDLSLIAPMEVLISQFTNVFLDPNEMYDDFFKKPNASSVLPLFYMELGQVHFIRGNFGDAYRVFTKLKSSVGSDFSEQKKLETLCNISGQIFLKKGDPSNFYEAIEHLIANKDFGDTFFNILIDNYFYKGNKSLKNVKFDSRIPKDVKQKLFCLDALREAIACGSCANICTFEHEVVEDVVQRVMKIGSDNETLNKIEKVFEEYKRCDIPNEIEETLLEPPRNKILKTNDEEAKILSTFGENFDAIDEEEMWSDFFVECRKKSSDAVCSVLGNLVHLRMVLMRFFDDEATAEDQEGDENAQDDISRYRKFDQEYNIKRSFTTTVHKMMMLYNQNRDSFYSILKSFKTIDFLWVLSSMTFGSLYKLSKRRTSKQIWLNEVGTFKRYNYTLCKIMDVLIPEKVKDAKPIAEFFSILVHFQWDTFKDMHNVSLAYAIGDAHFFNCIFENVHEDARKEDEIESEARNSLHWYFMGACFETDAFSIFKCSIFKLCLLNVIACLQIIDKRRGGQIIKILALSQLLPPGVKLDEEMVLEDRREFGLQNDSRYLQLFWDMSILENLSRKQKKININFVISFYLFIFICVYL